MNDPFPRSQLKGLGETLPRDSEEGRGGALREYDFLTLVGPCQNQPGHVCDVMMTQKGGAPQTSTQTSCGLCDGCLLDMMGCYLQRLCYR